MTLSLHQAEEKADWELIPPSARNKWQKIAFRTNGIITPGNIITLTGGILTITGIYLLTIADSQTYGIPLIVGGRIADIADGIAAHVTGTKSPIGEAVDAVTDKILLFVAVIALVSTGLLPYLAAIILFAHSLGNSIISLAARRKHVALHPSRAGKRAAFISWLALVLYPLAEILKSDQLGFSRGVSFSAHACMIIFVLLALVSSYEYFKQMSHHRVTR